MSIHGPWALLFWALTQNTMGQRHKREKLLITKQSGQRKGDGEIKELGIQYVLQGHSFMGLELQDPNTSPKAASLKTIPLEAKPSTYKLFGTI